MMSCVAVLPHKGLPLIEEMLVYATSTSSMDILNPAWAFEECNNIWITIANDDERHQCLLHVCV